MTDEIRAAELKPGDEVEVSPGDVRRVTRADFTGRAVDSNGTEGVQVYWDGGERPSTVPATKEFNRINR